MMIQKIVISKNDFRAYKALKTAPIRNTEIRNFLFSPSVSAFIDLKNKIKKFIINTPEEAKEYLGEECFNKFCSIYNLSYGTN